MKRDVQKQELLEKQKREEERKEEMIMLKKQQEELAKKYKTNNRKKKIKPKREMKIDEVSAESKISKSLSEKNTRTVIILILSTLFLLPFFEYSTYVTNTTSYEVGISMVKSSKEEYYPTNAQHFDKAYD